MVKDHKSSQTSPLEIFKDFLIVALLCSAIFLLWESQLLVGFSTSLTPPTTNVEASEYGLQVAAARPFRIATITDENGALYGLQYDDDALDELFLLSSNLLRETLSSLSAPSPISEATWRSHLQKAPGLYMDMGGEIPLSVLTGWLSNTSNPSQTDAPIRMLLTVQNNQLALYYQLSNNQFYCCTSEVIDPARLTTLVEQTSPNGAHFAFQSTQLADIAPYTLISPTTPTPISFTASNPVSSDANRTELLELLDFSDRGGSIYTSTDGVGIVVRYNSDTLRILGNGIVTYEGDPLFSHYPIPFVDTAPTTYDIVEKCRSIASTALTSFCGDARLQLLHIVTNENCTTITFGYLLNGALVHFSDGGEAAQFIVEDGGISSFTLRMRNYALNSNDMALLPAVQASAAMVALGYKDLDLVLAYFDNGGSVVTANWTAR